MRADCLANHCRCTKFIESRDPKKVSPAKTVLNSTLLRDAIGQTLKAERNNQKRTLRDVSKQAIMALGYLSEIERGVKEISSEMLESLCSALYISTTDFMADVVTYMRKMEDEQINDKLGEFNA